MSDAALGAAGIGWRVGGAQILDDVTLGVAAGELVGIIGPNGAGKSSLRQHLLGDATSDDRPGHPW